MASGPAVPYETCSLFFVEAIHAANQRVWITTPYFVPDDGLAQVLCLAVRRGSRSAGVGGAATGQGSFRPWLFGGGTARCAGGRSVAGGMRSGGALCVSHGGARSAQRCRRRSSGRPRDSTDGSAEQREAESLEEGRRRRRVQRRRKTATEFLREHGGAACESFVERRNRESAERERRTPTPY